MMGKLRSAAGALALLWMCVIFAFSAQPKDESSAVSGALSYRMVSSTRLLFHLHLDEEKLREIAVMIESTVRKAAHMTEFAILSVLLYIWLGKWQFPVKKKSLAAVSIATCYAASDEIHQLFVPGRAGMAQDVLIDGVGALLGVALFIGVRKCISFLWNRHKYRKTKSS